MRRVFFALLLTGVVTFLLITPSFEAGPSSGEPSPTPEGPTSYHTGARVPEVIAVGYHSPPSVPGLSLWALLGLAGAFVYVLASGIRNRDANSRVRVK